MIKRDDGAVGILKLEGVVHVVQRLLPHNYKVEGAHCPCVQLVLESDSWDEEVTLLKRGL